MPGPHPATAAVRLAVRDVLAECEPGDLVLVACSGGSDSLALALAAVFEAPKLSLGAGAVVVDHGLQAGSAATADAVAQQLRDIGADPVEVIAVQVDAGGAGLEANARTARYAALDEAAERLGARLILLGHTRDDQAEQVLLGLARGSGARSLSGMPAARGRCRRPLLSVSREQCQDSVTSQGHTWWEDPMNQDPSFLRVRARRVLEELELALGPGIPAALTRTADQLREDADYLDALAGAALRDLGRPPWPVDRLEGLPGPIRRRLWRAALTAAGAPEVAAAHVRACEALVTGWRGQGPVSAPGAVSVRRSEGRIHIVARRRVE